MGPYLSERCAAGGDWWNRHCCTRGTGQMRLEVGRPKRREAKQIQLLRRPPARGEAFTVGIRLTAGGDGKSQNIQEDV
uniref:Uncharacterized protein n=1 Tax=Leersia perrieri TaxID=77586 RepID=A0A0D9WD64_9ORYZ